MSDLWESLLTASFITTLGAMVIFMAEVSFNWIYVVAIFGASWAIPEVYGHAKRPSKSQRQVDKAEAQKDKAIRQKDKMEEEKKEVLEKMEETQKKAEELEKKNKELEESVKDRQENMTEEINEKAEKKAEELAEDKAKELLEEWKKEERKNLAEEMDLSNLAYYGKVKRESEERAERISSKFMDFVKLLIQDEEILEFINDRGIENLTAKQLGVLIRADSNPDLRKELDQVREVNGDVDLWMDQKIEDLEEKEIFVPSEKKPSERSKSEKKQIETISPAEQVRSPETTEETTEEDTETETEEKEPTDLEEEWYSLDETIQDVMILIDEGFNTAPELSDSIGVSDKTIQRRYNKLKEKDLINTGINGVSLTERGREMVEAIK